MKNKIRTLSQPEDSLPREDKMPSYAVEGLKLQAPFKNNLN